MDFGATGGGYASHDNTLALCTLRLHLQTDCEIIQEFSLLLHFGL